MVRARQCFECGKPIGECFGFVNAGDALLVLAGERTDPPRELCGVCALKPTFGIPLWSDFFTDLRKYPSSLPSD